MQEKNPPSLFECREKWLILGESLNEKVMLDTIKKFLKEHDIDEKAGFIITVSGGADSITLLHAFKYLNLRIHALHCNFNLRGKESNMDEQFVKRFCETYGIPMSVKRFETREYAQKKGISIEMAARELRYAWFEEMRLKKKMDYIVVGHHADDLAETLFINICRGTGIKGLTGIRPVKDKILRPLLSRSREEIIAYIEQNQLGYRTDSTNNSLDYVRNKIRHLIIPVCKEINPSFLNTVQENCNTLKEVEQIYKYGIDCLKANIVSEENGEILIDIQKTMASPAPYTFLFEFLRPYGFNATQIEDILHSNEAIPGKQFEAGEYLLTKGRVYWRLFNILEKEEERTLLADSGEYHLDDYTFTLGEQEIDDSFQVPQDSEIGCFDLDKITYPLVLRHWSTGDWFCPLGMKRSKKKLSDLFTDLKFSAKQKKECLILQSGKDIIWVVGHRIDDRYKVSPATKRVLTVKRDTK